MLSRHLPCLSPVQFLALNPQTQTDRKKHPDKSRTHPTTKKASSIVSQVHRANLFVVVRNKPRRQYNYNRLFCRCDDTKKEYKEEEYRSMCARVCVSVLTAAAAINQAGKSRGSRISDTVTHPRTKHPNIILDEAREKLPLQRRGTNRALS